MLDQRNAKRGPAKIDPKCACGYFFEQKFAGIFLYGALEGRFWILRGSWVPRGRSGPPLAFSGQSPSPLWSGPENLFPRRLTLNRCV